MTQWPKSGVKQTLVDNLDTKFTFTYKFVYGSNLNADGATEDDDVPIVRGDPVSKKKKSDSGIDLGLAIGVLIAAVILAFCCGAVRGPRPLNASRRWRIRANFTQACCVYRRRKGDPVAEVNGMEMGEVTVIESAPEATVKAVEVPPPPVEGTPNPVRAEGEMI